MMPDKESIGVSAKPLSEGSVREQGDQVTEGRFEPIMIDTHVNTDRKLLDSYLKKETKEQNFNTEPVMFNDSKPVMSVAMVQTEPQIDEHEMPAEPTPVDTAQEPLTSAMKDPADVDSNGSLCDIPATEEMFELVLPPPQEPEEEPITDDWAFSSLYEYVFQSHYERMVKKRLYCEKTVIRPQTAQSQEGMS